MKKSFVMFCFNVLSLVEVTVQNFRLFLLKETAFKVFTGTLMQIYKICLYVRVHIKIVSSKFRILNPRNSRVTYP